MSRSGPAYNRYANSAEQAGHEPTPATRDNKAESLVGAATNTYQVSSNVKVKTTFNKQLLYPVPQRPFALPSRNPDSENRVVSLPETIPPISVKAALETSGALRVTSMSERPKPLSMENEQPRHTHYSSPDFYSSSFLDARYGTGYDTLHPSAQPRSTAAALYNYDDAPQTPSPPSSAADSVDIISNNDVYFPEAFLRSTSKAVPAKVAPEDDLLAVLGELSSSTYSGTSRTLLAALCSLPVVSPVQLEKRQALTIFASGAEGIIFAEPAEVPRVIWGLGADGHQTHSRTNSQQHPKTNIGTPQMDILPQAGHTGSNTTPLQRPTSQTPHHHVASTAVHSRPVVYSRPNDHVFQEDFPADFRHYERSAHGMRHDPSLNLDEVISRHLQHMLSLNPYLNPISPTSPVGIWDGNDPDVTRLPLGVRGFAGADLIDYNDYGANYVDDLPPRRKSAFELAQEYRARSWDPNRDTATPSDSSSPMWSPFVPQLDFLQRTPGSPESLISQPSRTPVLSQQPFRYPEQSGRLVTRGLANTSQELLQLLTKQNPGLNISNVGLPLGAPANIIPQEIPAQHNTRAPSASSRMSPFTPNPPPQGPQPPRSDSRGFNQRIHSVRAPITPLSPVSPDPNVRGSGTQAQPQSVPFARMMPRTLESVPEELPLSQTTEDRFYGLPNAPGRSQPQSHAPGPAKASTHMPSPVSPFSGLHPQFQLSDDRSEISADGSHQLRAGTIPLRERPMRQTDSRRFHRTPGRKQHNRTFDSDQGAPDTDRPRPKGFTKAQVPPKKPQSTPEIDQ
ncbi:hypothetical protein HGRIS_002535 [Hohenbuehelia grisea]|uniref:Uncharacterized protein n=1 Tax=Hohenbuehelia grisea TaxID=104357 RepID=A0ABR3JKT2_9AGAR